MACSDSRRELLASCHLRYGDAFTLRLPVGQRMTFVLAPAALSYYFQAPDVLTFGPAVEQFITVFGLKPSEFAHKHLLMLKVHPPVA